MEDILKDSVLCEQLNNVSQSNMRAKLQRGLSHCKSR